MTIHTYLIGWLNCDCPNYTFILLCDPFIPARTTVGHYSSLQLIPTLPPPFCYQFPASPYLLWTDLLGQAHLFIPVTYHYSGRNPSVIAVTHIYYTRPYSGHCWWTRLYVIYDYIYLHCGTFIYDSCYLLPTVTIGPFTHTYILPWVTHIVPHLAITLPHHIALPTHVHLLLH